MKNMMDYFKSEKDFNSYMLLYGTGENRTSALRISAKLYSDKEAAKAWLEWITANTDGEEETSKEIARLYKRMTGTEPSEEPVEETEEVEEAEAPRTFKVGQTVWSPWEDFNGGKVTKVTKCYVWTKFDGEVERKKIRKDDRGNEFVEYIEKGATVFYKPME